MKTMRAAASEHLPLGASCQGQNCYFKVWAPYCSSVDVKILKSRQSFLVPLRKDARGYFWGRARQARAGDRYVYRLDHAKERPDPASFYQPQGVHGPSQIVRTDRFRWTDQSWKGLRLPELVIYELHIGTFTLQGTFEAAIKKIPYLKKLGITCVELLPLAQFPGKRNWGYDGVGLYAVQNSYGGPERLKKFVNACHREGLGVCLDVVYNHFGPEGNYLNDYGPYFTKKYHTPWGDAVNYDDHGSREVRRFVIQNALYWIREFHFDGLRLDAVHGIFDASNTHLLKELNNEIQKLGRSLGREVLVIAESDLNDSQIIRPKKQKGYGLHGQWSDDFHHAVHAILTGEKKGYYCDYGQFRHVVKALKTGFVYDGIYSAFRKRKHGNKVSDLPPEKLVVCTQNHDQVGNRAWGDRLTRLVDKKKLDLAAALLLLGPHTPLLFMGEEYGEEAPFQYFIDHGDAQLVKAVQQGRKKEFESFGWKSVPDPASKKTFINSKLNWGKPFRGRHKRLWHLYRELISIRKKIFSGNPRGRMRAKIRANHQKHWIALEYPSKTGNFAIFFSFSRKRQIMKPRQGTVILNTAVFTGKPLSGPRIRPKMKKTSLILEPFSALVIQTST